MRPCPSSPPSQLIPGPPQRGSLRARIQRSCDWLVRVVGVHHLPESERVLRRRTERAGRGRFRCASLARGSPGVWELTQRRRYAESTFEGQAWYLNATPWWIRGRARRCRAAGGYLLLIAMQDRFSTGLEHAYTISSNPTSSAEPLARPSARNLSSEEQGGRSPAWSSGEQGRSEEHTSELQSQ